MQIQTEPRSRQLQEAIQPWRQQIIDHPLYASIKTMEDVRSFMRYHVYAVWDFMSLLKSLQRALTCTDVPWFPKGSATTRRLINEIVIGEESDESAEGVCLSHFELYLEAMRQSGADASEILSFTGALRQGDGLEAAFGKAGTPDKARQFVRQTFESIGSCKDHVQAAVFTFGREDLIPGMFLSMIRDLDQDFPGAITTFRYYLERHIEVDGDHHSHLALQMTEELCGTDDTKWEEAKKATIASLQARIALWDGVYEEVQRRGQ